MRGSWLRPAAVLLLFALPACSDDALPPLAFTNPPTELVAGREIDVSGRGCPARGPVELAQPEQVGVELIPLQSAAGYDQLVWVNESGALAFVGYALTVEMWAGQFAVDERGEWTGSLPVPQPLASGEWRLLATCLTLVKESSTTEPPSVPLADGTTVMHTFDVG